MKIISLLFFLLWMNPSAEDKLFSGNEDEGWTLRKNKNGVQVFTKENTETSFDLIKAECILPHTPKQLLCLISDVESHTKWVYNAVVTRTFKTVSDLEFYYYGETFAPWPVSNRDHVFHVKAAQNPNTKVIEIDVHSVPTLLPEVPGKVRVPRSHSHWILKPHPRGVLVTYTLDIDPGGSLPAWLVNLATVDGPYLSFEAMKKVLKENDYKIKKFPNIVE